MRGSSGSLKLLELQRGSGVGLTDRCMPGIPGYLGLLCWGGKKTSKEQNSRKTWEMAMRGRRRDGVAEP